MVHNIDIYTRECYSFRNERSEGEKEMVSDMLNGFLTTVMLGIFITGGYLVGRFIFGAERMEELKSYIQRVCRRQQLPMLSSSLSVHS